MKKLNHISLFEQFSPETHGKIKVYATCFQGDSYAAVGILNESEQKELQDAFDRALSENPDLIDFMKIEKIDVTGMGYVLHDVNGDFMAMPKSTNLRDYVYYINKDGEMPMDGSDRASNTEDRLFELVEGELLVIDHHSRTDLISVNGFINHYLGY